LREVDLPITPGYHFPMRYELIISHLSLSGTVIGNGCYGVVCGGTYRSMAVAVKVLQKPDSSLSDEEEFIEEGKTMMGLRHENVIRLVGVRCAERPMFIGKYSSFFLTNWF